MNVGEILRILLHLAVKGHTNNSIIYLTSFSGSGRVLLSAGKEGLL